MTSYATIPNKYNDNPEWATVDVWNAESAKLRHRKSHPQKNMVNVPPPIGLVEFHRYCDSFADVVIAPPVRFYDTAVVETIIEAASNVPRCDDIDDDECGDDYYGNNVGGDIDNQPF